MRKFWMSIQHRYSNVNRTSGRAQKSYLSNETSPLNIRISPLTRVTSARQT